MTLFRQFTFSMAAAALIAVFLIGGIGPTMAKDTSATSTYQVAQATLTPEEKAARKKKRQELRKAKKSKQKDAKQLKREERKKKKRVEKRKRKKANTQQQANQKRQDADKKKAAEVKKAAARKRAADAKKAADANKKAAEVRKAAARKRAADAKKAADANKKAAEVRKAAARKKAADARKAAAAKKKKQQGIKATQQQQQAGESAAKRKKRLKAVRQQQQNNTEQAAPTSRQSVQTPLRLTAEQKQRIERKQRRLRKVREERREAQVLAATGSSQQRARRKKRRLDLQLAITSGGVQAQVSTRRTLSDRRLQRQLEWERQQARRDRRQLRRDFGFHRRARLVRRRNDRIIYAGLTLGAVGGLFVYHDDDARFGRRARDVRVRPLRNGWTRTVVVRPNGNRIVTIRDARGFIVRRYRVRPNNQVTFFYNNQPSWWDDGDLHVDIEPVSVGIPDDRYIVEPSHAPMETIYETVTAPPVDELDRTYTLNQILVNARLRDYMPRIDLDTITFASGSAEVPPGQFDKLDSIGVAMEQAIKESPDEVYLIEGHTDATGSDEANLVLSDRRAAAVASALTASFDIPPENLVTQGYGEQFLKVDTAGPEQRNRRVALRRITPLLSREREQVVFDDNGNEIFDEEGVGQ